MSWGLGMPTKLGCEYIEMSKNLYTKKLTGHSGCELALYQSPSNTFFVRKFSPSRNSRLRVQCLKEKAFSHPVVRAPVVLRQGYSDGLYYFDMEFVVGKTLAEDIGAIRLNEIRQLANIRG